MAKRAVLAAGAIERVRIDRETLEVHFKGLNVAEVADVASQEILVRRKTIEEDLERHGRGAAELLAEVAEEAGVEAWEQRLEDTERRIGAGVGGALVALDAGEGVAPELLAPRGVVEQRQRRHLLLWTYRRVCR